MLKAPRFRAAHGADGVSFGTFHSIFFRILRSRYGWGMERVLAEEERRSAVRSILEGMEWDIPDLDPVHILKFVHQNITEPPLPVFPRLCVLFQQPVAFRQHIGRGSGTASRKFSPKAFRVFKENIHAKTTEP